MACVALARDMPDLAADLDWLQPLVFHLNGSVRGKMAVTEADIDQLKACLQRYRVEVAGAVKGFVLPRVINHRRQVTEMPFESLSYTIKRPKTVYGNDAPIHE
eukprot:gene16551-18881_t